MSGDRKNVGKTSNKVSVTLKRPVSEYVFPSWQKDTENLKNLKKNIFFLVNRYIPYKHFTMEGLKVYFFWKKFSRRTIICSR